MPQNTRREVGLGVQPKISRVSKGHAAFYAGRAISDYPFKFVAAIRGHFIPLKIYGWNRQHIFETVTTWSLRSTLTRPFIEIRTFLFP